MIDGRYDNWRIAGHDNDTQGDECNFDIVERIGSPSTAGIVYKLKNGHALKIMPIIDMNSISDNEREIMIATIASDSESPYFLRVYGSGSCENFIYSKHEETFRILSLAYDGKCEVNYLISELGLMDLNSWMTRYDEDMVPVFVREVIEGIIWLQEHNIIHSDLHIYNVLIVKRDNRLSACIHDFGLSFIGIARFQYYVDYKIFLMSIKDKLHKGTFKDWMSSLLVNLPSDWDSVNDKRDFMKFILKKYF